MITCNAITFDPNHYTHLQEGTIIPAWLQASVICAINCGIGKWRNSLPDLLMEHADICELGFTQCAMSSANWFESKDYLRSWAMFPT